VNFSRKGLVLAALELILVASPYAKFQIDRARCPRIWVKTESFDPYLPIRGRYIAMRLPVQVVNTGAAVTHPAYGPFFHAKLFVREGKLTVEIVPTESATGVWVTTANRRSDEYVLQQPVLFFLPEHAGNAQDLMAAARNGELWAEVTVPSSGLPRPIRLGIKHGDSFTPVEAK
jgi:hypothetical protein